MPRLFQEKFVPGEQAAVAKSSEGAGHLGGVVTDCGGGRVRRQGQILLRGVICIEEQNSAGGVLRMVPVEEKRGGNADGAIVEAAGSGPESPLVAECLLLLPRPALPEILPHNHLGAHIKRGSHSPRKPILDSHREVLL